MRAKSKAKSKNHETCLLPSPRWRGRVPNYFASLYSLQYTSFSVRISTGCKITLFNFDSVYAKLLSEDALDWNSSQFRTSLFASPPVAFPIILHRLFITRRPSVIVCRLCRARLGLQTDGIPQLRCVLLQLLFCELFQARFSTLGCMGFVMFSRGGFAGFGFKRDRIAQLGAVLQRLGILSPIRPTPQ